MTKSKFSTEIKISGSLVAYCSSSFQGLDPSDPSRGNSITHVLSMFNLLYLQLASGDHSRFCSVRVLIPWKNQSEFRILRFLIIGAGVAQAVKCLRTGRPGFNPQQRQRIFPLSPASRPALGPTQPPIQWVLGVLSLGVKRGRGAMLPTHSHLVPRLRMSRSYISSHPKRLHGV
jgi:hypothetical protein